MPFGFLKDISLKNDRLVVGLDIGTTKTCAVVGEIRPSGKIKTKGPFSEEISGRVLKGGFNSTGTKDRGFNIIGVGVADSKGIKKGVVTNIESAADSIKEAVQEAEKMAGVDIKAVQIGITGGHINCLLSQGVIAVKEKEIGRKEVDSVIDAARAVAIPFDRDILHVIPVGFAVNGQKGITDPRGMGGVRLETDVRIITAMAMSVQNLIKSCKKNGIDVVDVVFQPLASADAVLTHDEKDLGVAVIDIGGGTTDIALFQEGHICHSAVLDLGGNNFTNDIAIGMRIPTRHAEILKKTHGCSMISLINEDEEVETGRVDGKTGRRIPRRYLVEILQPRAEELFALIKEEITGKGFHKGLNSGIVLTGGAVLMEGMDVMAENILELPVRIGSPVGIGSVSDIIYDPAYATGVGLAFYGAEESLTERGFEGGNMFDGIKIKMKTLLGDALNLRSQ